MAKETTQSTEPAQTPPMLVHCPYRRATDLLQRLAPGKMRIGFIIGAGCPLSVQVTAAGGATRPLIPEIIGLTQQVKAFLDAGELKTTASTMWERVIARGIAKPTVEDVLGHIRTLRSLSGNGAVDGFSAIQLDNLDLAICVHIRGIASQQLPTSDTPYHVLASWIQAIARERPVEIFTTNYDLLLEQALEEQQVPYFDGFISGDRDILT